jgi:hypothetical protein
MLYLSCAVDEIANIAASLRFGTVHASHCGPFELTAFAHSVQSPWLKRRISCEQERYDEDATHFSFS